MPELLWQIVQIHIHSRITLKIATDTQICCTVFLSEQYGDNITIGASVECMFFGECFEYSILLPMRNRNSL